MTVYNPLIKWVLQMAFMFFSHWSQPNWKTKQYHCVTLHGDVRHKFIQELTKLFILEKSV